MAQIPFTEDILAFWFGDPQSEDSRYQQRRKLWFVKHPATDQQIRDRFLSCYEWALTHIVEQPAAIADILALIILFDQFPRNMFRGEARAFATDARALALAKGAIAQGLDRQLPPIQRLFVYLPLEHSEQLADQHQSVLLFEQLSITDPELVDAFDYALRHRTVIERFGRFPHRNAILGRPSTPDEEAFLKQPGSSF